MRIILFFILFLFSGCAVKNLDSTPNLYINLSQDALMYAPLEMNADFNEHAMLDLKENYLNAYFNIWDKDFILPSKEDVFWGLNAKSGFDESKKKISDVFFNEITKNMQIDSYPNMAKDGVAKKAIMIKGANVRVLPTIKPRYSKIDGYPFDRWQNSYIFAFTPIIVLHEDLHKEWVLIQSSFVSGWVKSDEIAYISQKEAQSMIKANQFLIPIKDKIPLYNNGVFVQNARIGMLFQKYKDKIAIYLRGLKGEAIKVLVKYDKEDFRDFPLPLNEINIANIADSIGRQNYGWGGMYESRDCSSFIRDVFASFAIWLPRNSKAQVEYGKISPYSRYMQLPKDNDEKIKFIKEYAKPFKTIIWLQGHIMLYIGQVDGNPIVMHQVWALNSNKGREILSRISITTLTPVLSKIDIQTSDSKNLLDRIQAINILF